MFTNRNKYFVANTDVQAVLKSAYGLKEMRNFEPIACDDAAEIRRSLKSFFSFKRPARPLYHDHAMMAGC